MTTGCISVPIHKNYFEFAYDLLPNDVLPGRQNTGWNKLLIPRNLRPFSQIFLDNPKVDNLTTVIIAQTIIHAKSKAHKGEKILS
jgi:hypothetical protein